MKRNQIITILAIASAVFFFTATAQAGSGDALLTGLAVGVGAAIVGGAIASSVHGPTVVAHRVGPRYSSTCRPQYEIRSIWVPPVYNTVYNPPHYDPNGYWVQGGYTQVVVRPGYYRKERVYVGCRPVVHPHVGFSVHIGGPSYHHGHVRPHRPSGHHSPNSSGGSSSFHQPGHHTGSPMPHQGGFHR